MQTVSSDFSTAAAASIKAINQGCLIAWDLTANLTTNWFTIGTSKIGGADLIKGAGGAITFFDKYQYADESAKVLSWQIVRKLSQRPYGVVIATATMTLDNNTRRYTPNFDGTIGALILPNRAIKLQTGFAGESIQQFVGYTDIPNSPLIKRQTTITAYDAVSYLANCKSALQAFVNTTTDSIITQLLAEQGFSGTQYSIELSLQQPISYYNPNGRKVIDMLKELCEAEVALMFVNENGIITFWNRQHFNNNRTSRWTFNYSNVTDLNWDNTPIINSVAVTAQPNKVTAKMLVFTNGQSITLAPNTTTDVFADFKDSVGSFPCVSIDVVLPIASSTSSEYTVNYSTDGSGLDAAAGVSLTSSYLFGDSYKMTYTNTTSQNIYITKLELYGVPAKVQILDTQTQDDTVSQANFGINPANNGNVLSINNNTIQNTGAAKALAYVLVKQYATPMTRLICPAFAVPHLQIGDAVTVNIADGNQSKLCFIVGITTSISRGNLLQEFDVEERSTYDYFTIGASKIGGSDSLAP